jgi:hypothetical protein
LFHMLQLNVLVFSPLFLILNVWSISLSCLNMSAMFLLFILQSVIPLFDVLLHILHLNMCYACLDSFEVACSTCLLQSLSYNPPTAWLFDHVKTTYTRVNKRLGSQKSYQVMCCIKLS